MFLVIISIASVQCGGAIAKRLFDTAGPGGTVLLRLGLSALLLLVVVRPRVRGLARPALGAAALFGLVLAAMNFSFYLALDRIPLGVAVTIEFVGPLAVAVTGSRRRRDLVWALLAAGGVALLTSSGGGAVTMAGVLLALVAGGFWAAYILLSQRVGRLIPGTTGLALALAVGAVVLLPVGVVSGGSALLRPPVLAVGAAVALLSSAIPYSLELVALRRLPAAVFGVLMSLEPAMAALAGFVILGEALHGRELIAIAMVCAASVGVSRLAPEPGTAPVES